MQELGQRWRGEAVEAPLPCTGPGGGRLAATHWPRFLQPGPGGRLRAAGGAGRKSLEESVLQPWDLATPCWASEGLPRRSATAGLPWQEGQGPGSCQPQLWPGKQLQGQGRSGRSQQGWDVVCLPRAPPFHPAGTCGSLCRLHLREGEGWGQGRTGGGRTNPVAPREWRQPQARVGWVGPSDGAPSDHCPAQQTGPTSPLLSTPSLVSVWQCSVAQSEPRLSPARLGPPGSGSGSLPWSRAANPTLGCRVSGVLVQWLDRMQAAAMCCHPFLHPTPAQGQRAGAF